MVLKLYGNPHSTCTKRVRTVIAELGLEHELVLLDFAKGDHKAPDFLKLQPFGQMPVLDDDGFIVFESRAICRYLALQKGKLIPSPTDIKKTAIFEQAVSIEMCNFDPSASGLAFENVFKPVFYNGQPDAARVETLTTTLDGKLAAYDVLLGKTKYLAGDELTLADIFHLPYGSMLAAQKIDLLESGKYPNVTRWWKEVSSLESWKTANTV